MAVIKLWGLAHTLVTFFLAAVPGEGERLGEEVSLASGDEQILGPQGSSRPLSPALQLQETNAWRETSHSPLKF